MSRKPSKSSFITYEHYAKSYLLMARILLIEKSEGYYTSRIGIDAKWRIETGLVLIPTIYCIRHSVELFLKSIDIGTTGSFSYSHSLKQLKTVLGKLSMDVETQHQTELLVKKYSDYQFSKDIIKYIKRKI